MLITERAQPLEITGRGLDDPALALYRALKGPPRLLQGDTTPAFGQPRGACRAGGPTQPGKRRPWRADPRSRP